jgi:hypothetical protein
MQAPSDDRDAGDLISGYTDPAASDQATNVSTSHSEPQGPVAEDLPESSALEKNDLHPSSSSTEQNLRLPMLESCVEDESASASPHLRPTVADLNNPLYYVHHEAGVEREATEELSQEPTVDQRNPAERVPPSVSTVESAIGGGWEAALNEHVREQVQTELQAAKLVLSKGKPKVAAREKVQRKPKAATREKQPVKPKPSLVRAKLVAHSAKPPPAAKAVTKKAPPNAKRAVKRDASLLSPSSTAPGSPRPRASNKQKGSTSTFTAGGTTGRVGASAVGVIGGHPAAPHAVDLNVSSLQPPVRLLAYDWSALGLGTTAGSAAWNKALRDAKRSRLCALYESVPGSRDVRSEDWNVPQLSAVECLYQVQSRLSAFNTDGPNRTDVRPPPQVEEHMNMSEVISNTYSEANGIVQRLYNSLVAQETEGTQPVDSGSAATPTSYADVISSSPSPFPHLDSVDVNESLNVPFSFRRSYLELTTASDIVSRLQKADKAVSDLFKHEQELRLRMAMRAITVATNDKSPPRVDLEGPTIVAPLVIKEN